MGSRNPYSPGYQAGAGSDRSVGNVGHGEDFGADTYRLYLAGRSFIPATANLYAANTEAASSVGATLGSLSGLHPTVKRMNSILEQMHRALYRTTTSLHETATALVEIADDYVATDEKAREAFDTLFKDDHTLDKGENSPPPLAPENLPAPFEEPREPGTYGQPEFLPGRPGIGGL